jgi:hypothetical protein
MNPTGRKPRLSRGKPEERNAYRVLVGKLAGRRTLVRPRRGWEHIKMDSREIGLGVYGLVSSGRLLMFL